MSAAHIAGLLIALVPALVLWFFLGQQGHLHRWTGGWRKLAYATLAIAFLIAAGATSGIVPAALIFGADALLLGPLMLLLGHATAKPKSKEELVKEVMEQRRIPETELSKPSDTDS